MSLERPNQDEVAHSLRTLESKGSTLEEKRRAFSVVRQSLVPVIHQTQEYAAELASVFSLRFDMWPSSQDKPPVKNPHLLSDRIRRLVFGGALGDAIGLSTEFMSQTEVAERYG